MDLESNEYEVVVIGGGGAGLTAALYTARSRRRTVVFERAVTGGQIATTDRVENYPGFPGGVNGFDLAQAFLKQAEQFGAEIRYEEATKLERLDDGRFRLETAAGPILARAVIDTAGADYNRLGVPGELELTGKGVSYCGTCDAAFFQDQEVFVAGGGDSAMQEGIFIARYASAVHVIHRRDTLRATAILQERAHAEPKIDFTWDTAMERIEGDGRVERVHLRNLETGEQSVREAGGVFIFIGQKPNSSLVADLVELDRGGHAIVGLQMETAVPGLYCAGDLRTLAARQLVSAAGDGATAAVAAEHYLQQTYGGPAALPRTTKS